MQPGFRSRYHHSVRTTRWLALGLAAVVGLQSSVLCVAARPAAGKTTTMTADQRVTHVLSRLTFGARPGDFEKVKAMGVEAFINQQLDPDSIDNSTAIARLRRLPTLNLATPVIIEQYTPPKPAASPSPAAAKTAEAMNASEAKPAVQIAPQLSANPSMAAMANEMQADVKKDDAGSMPALQERAPQPSPKPTPSPKNPQMVVNELQRAKLLRAVYSDRQLYELMVDFWENHFSIFANKDEDRYLLTGFDRETIRPFVLGRFRDLLGATAHSPAMLFYLDNWRSSVPRPYPIQKATSRPASMVV